MVPKIELTPKTRSRFTSCAISFYLPPVLWRYYRSYNHHLRRMDLWRCTTCALPRSHLELSRLRSQMLLIISHNLWPTPSRPANRRWLADQTREYSEEAGRDLLIPDGDWTVACSLGRADRSSCESLLRSGFHLFSDCFRRQYRCMYFGRANIRGKIKCVQKINRYRTVATLSPAIMNSPAPQNVHGVKIHGSPHCAQCSHGSHGG